MKRTLIALLLVVGSAACAGPTPDPGRGVEGIAAWLHEITGECVEVQPGNDFATFVGPVRAKVYEPLVVAWGTCTKEPYQRLGLIVLRQGIEEAWHKALVNGEVRGDPDLAFGDGFALTGSIGMEHLGLTRLECSPVCTHVKIRHH